MGSYLRVLGKMVTEMCLLCEAVTTHLAHKWLVTCVHFFMNQEVVLPLEGFAAVGAHKGAVAVPTGWVPEPVQVQGLPGALQQMRGEPALASDTTVATQPPWHSLPPHSLHHFAQSTHSPLWFHPQSSRGKAVKAALGRAVWRGCEVGMGVC